MKDLFKPAQLGAMEVANRIVMAPMTRARATNDTADALTALYYAQRATAGLIISEGTPISAEGQGYLFNPGIFTAEQIEGWKLTTQSVHALGGKIFAQLWHVGRVSHPSIKTGRPPVSASTIPPNGACAFGYDEDGAAAFLTPPAPTSLDLNGVEGAIADFAQAALNAMEAGFDGVEIHGANGYLFEQFLNPGVNDREDHYGAQSLENRLRFTISVIDRVVEQIGAGRVGIRLSPYSGLFDMPPYAEVTETYLALSEAISARNLAYVHLMSHAAYGEKNDDPSNFSSKFMDLLRQMRAKMPNVALILAGGMTKASALEMLAQTDIDFAAFGTPFISNPDLVARMKADLPLAPAQKATFYGGAISGYVDYPPLRLLRERL